MTENLAGRGEGLAGLGDELNQCLQIIVTNAGNIISFNVGAFRDEDIHGAALAIEKAVDRAAKAIRAALEAAARLPSVGQAPPSTAHNELSLVRLVLSAHQTAYARFHNGEGRGVIEADQMAIGYASVELAKALAQKEQQ